MFAIIVNIYRRNVRMTFKGCIRSLRVINSGANLWSIQLLDASISKTITQFRKQIQYC